MKKRWIALALFLLIALGGFLGLNAWKSAHLRPPARDYRAEIAVIDARLAEGKPHDDALVAVLDELEERWHAERGELISELVEVHGRGWLPERGDSGTIWDEQGREPSAEERPIEESLAAHARSFVRDFDPRALAQVVESAAPKPGPLGRESQHGAFGSEWTDAWLFRRTVWEMYDSLELDEDIDLIADLLLLQVALTQYAARGGDAHAGHAATIRSLPDLLPPALLQRVGSIGDLRLLLDTVRSIELNPIPLDLYIDRVLHAEVLYIDWLYTSKSEVRERHHEDRRPLIDLPSHRAYVALIEELRAASHRFVALPYSQMIAYQAWPEGVGYSIENRCESCEFVFWLGKMIESTMQEHAIRPAFYGAALLNIAIELHRRETGRLPATLDELVDRGILDELPEDPFAKDLAFRYRLDEQAPHGYVLYSDGWNQTDDGAPEPPESSRIWHPGPGRTHAMAPDLMLEPPHEWYIDRIWERIQSEP